MTHQARWTSVMSRIAPTQAENIDKLLGAFDPRTRRMGREVFPETAGEVPFIAPFRHAETICIGYRVVDPDRDLSTIAMQLCALSIERNVEIIVLSEHDYSGLERFGFRSERICGATRKARETCEAQLIDFWNIEVVI